jgi:hypothetical protein
MFLKSLILLIVASFTFSLVNAQEVKEEKKVIKIKMMSDEDGNVTLDTSFVLDEDFDGDWKALVHDEDLLKKLEEMDIDLDIQEGSKIYMVKSPHTTKSGYFYSIDSEDGENVVVEIKTGGEGTENIWVSEIDGDSTFTIMLKSSDCKHESHDGEHKVVVSKTMNVEIETMDGDSVMTYTIKTSGGDGNHENIMIWHSDGNEKMTHDILMKKIDGDSCKVIIMTTGDDGEAVKVVKHKEFIIITEEVEDHDHDHDKDKHKDKKKNKKK